MAQTYDDKLRTEHYENFGGMNSKANAYNVGPMEFVDLSNFDFQKPGSLSQRWGSTLYMSQNFSGPISALYEYVKLDGTSGLIAGVSGGLWFGATTGQAQGLSLTYQGITAGYVLYYGDITTSLGGLHITSNSVDYQGNHNIVLNRGVAESSGNGVSVYLSAQSWSSNNMDFVTFQNYLFMANGTAFLKFDGTTTSPVGLPPATWQGSAGVTFSSSSTLVGFAQNATYTFYFFASYVNRRGFEGPAWPFGSVVFDATIAGATAASLGGTYALVSYTVNTPLQYDIASINLYCYARSSGSSLAADYWAANGLYRLLSNTPVSGSTFTTVVAGSSIVVGQNYMVGNQGIVPPLVTYLPLGFTLKMVPNTVRVAEVDITNYSPRFLEIHQNRLFLAGFSTTPSTVWFSDVAEPEGYDPSFNFEVRTNDGDRITALQEYNSRLYVFKQFSFHELSGDNPDNFFLRQVTDQYGCLSNRATAVFNNLMLFLDSKGVIQFNGAGLQCISDKMQSVFDTMNITAAIDQATMIHDKSRNQVLIGIPINGSTVNNMTIVYDYLVGAWSKYEGYNPAIYANAKQRFVVKTPMYGGYSGQIMNFGASLAGDNGAGFTCYAKAPFRAELGQSVEKQYRRHWMNFDEVTGATVPININYFQDYGASIVLNRTVYLSPFQSRLDFGIPAKSLAFEFSKFSATTMIRFHGYAMGYRLQRSV